MEKIKKVISVEIEFELENFQDVDMSSSGESDI